MLDLGCSSGNLINYIWKYKPIYYLGLYIDIK